MMKSEEFEEEEEEDDYDEVKRCRGELLRAQEDDR